MDFDQFNSNEPSHRHKELCATGEVAGELKYINEDTEETEFLVKQ